MANSQPLIVPFDFDGLNIRTVTRGDSVWFVASDVCSALDIQNATDAVKRLDEDERSRFNLGRQGAAIIINESGLYALILGSRKPEARRFRKWVTSEVLPAIRKTGQYQDDWRKSRHAAASSAKVMTGILEFVRETFGKVTKPQHYMNEHKLVNSLLTGEYKGLDREALSTLELDFLAHFELREAMFIGMGMSYEQRKQRLLRESADWKAKRLGGNDDCAMIAA